MASLAKGKLGNRLNDDVILRNDWNGAREQQSILNLYQEIGDIRNGLAHNTFMKVPETTFSQQLKELIAEHVRPLSSFAFSRTFGDHIQKGNKTSAERNQ